MSKIDNYAECVDLLTRRGIDKRAIASCTHFLQGRYREALTIDECLMKVEEVLHDPDIQNAVIIALELDILAENDTLNSRYIKDAMMKDDGLFGVDELIGLGMAFNYGPIAITSFGYIDKVKPEIIGILNTPKDGVCNTFADDVVGAIAACAASLLAHD